MNEPTDLELLTAWRIGDADAGSRLVERQFSTVYRFFRRKLPDPDIAKDLTQKTFVNCLEVRHNIRDGVRFKAFLLGIARNMLLRHLRSTALRKEDPMGHPEGVLQQTSPSLVVAMREEQRLLLRALRQLPEDLQMTLELHYWEELTTAEVAQVLDVAAGTVKWRLSRARELLRKRIAAIGTGPAAESTIRDLDRWAASIRKLIDDDATPR